MSLRSSAKEPLLGPKPMGSSSAFTCSSIRHICVKVDFRSAFSTTERERMVEAFANDTELNDMHRYMESHLRPRSRIYYTYPEVA